jgi:hypothetical protein
LAAGSAPKTVSDTPWNYSTTILDAAAAVPHCAARFE